jgi:hypothetical protein
VVVVVVAVVVVVLAVITVDAGSSDTTCDMIEA